MQLDTWTTEGKGKGIIFIYAEYLRRKSALMAENVLAFSLEWIMILLIIVFNKGGTADCPQSVL